MEDTATMTAVPSMLLLHPMGSTNLVMRGSILISLSITWNVTGKAAALVGVKGYKRRSLNALNLISTYVEAHAAAVNIGCNNFP